MTATVAAVWRYPASSLAGEPLRTADVGPGGIAGDRLFGLVDAATGDIARPVSPDRRWSRIAHVESRLGEDGWLQVRLPQGEWLAATSAQAERAFSDFIGFGVRILPFEGAPLACYAGARTEPRYVKAPIHLLTTASLARLASLYPAGIVDACRFRPNLVIDLPAMDGRFPESEWTGRRLAIGEVELVVAEPCRRCGFTTLSQQGLPEDPGILRNIVRHNAHNLGIYCTVARPGRVAVGDAVRLLDQ